MNQAGQFISGQTNYSKISSVQGHCFYPAGHLWHYVPIYWLHMFTDQAENCVKILHMLIHSATLILVIKIGYKYFDAYKSQLLCFILMTN